MAKAVPVQRTVIDGWTVTLDKNDMALVELALWHLYYEGSSKPSITYREKAKLLREELVEDQRQVWSKHEG